MVRHRGVNFRINYQPRIDSFVCDYNLLFYLRGHSFDMMSSSYLILKGYFRFVIYSECIQLDETVVS